MLVGVVVVDPKHSYLYILSECPTNSFRIPCLLSVSQKRNMFKSILDTLYLLSQKRKMCPSTLIKRADGQHRR